MNKIKIILFFVFCLIAGVIVVVNFKSSAKVTLPKSQSVWVKASPVVKAPLNVEVEAMGTLIAHSVKITPEIAGRVQKITFIDGSFVKSGTPLIQLEDELYKTKFESAKARLFLSENNLKRLKQLLKQRVTTPQQVDEAEADWREKVATKNEAELMLKKTTITAPFDGKVNESKVNLGENITIGQDIVTITDLKDLRIQYQVSENYLPLLKYGQLVTITTAAYPNKTFTGKLTYISPTINTENRSILLYASVPNEDGLLTAGMFVNVTQSLNNKNDALMIPSRSLVPMLEGQQVYRVQDGKAYAVSVLIGKRSADKVQVVQGLSAGDVVITDGQLKLRNGIPIEISKNNKVSS